MLSKQVGEVAHEAVHKADEQPFMHLQESRGMSQMSQFVRRLSTENQVWKRLCDRNGEEATIDHSVMR